MKKKMKRIVRSILTMAIVVTMLFGQTPSGFVLIANAEPGNAAENGLDSSEMPSMLAGVGAVIENDLGPDSENVLTDAVSGGQTTSETDDENKSEPDSNIIVEDTSVIPDDTSETKTSEEDSKVDESESEKKGDGDDATDSTLIRGLKLVKEALKGSESLLRGPGGDGGTETEKTIINESDIIIGLVKDYKEYDGSPNFPENSDYLSCSINNGPAFDEALEINQCKIYSGNDEVFSVGDNYYVKVTVSAKENVVIVDGDEEKTSAEIILSPVSIKQKQVKVTGVVLEGSREYEEDQEGNGSIDASFITNKTYIFEGLVAEEDAENITISGLEFELENADVPNPGVTYNAVKLSSDSDFSYDADNYEVIYNRDDFVINYAQVIITPKKVYVSFSDDEGSKDKPSDGNNTFVYKDNKSWDNLDFIGHVQWNDPNNKNEIIAVNAFGDAPELLYSGNTPGKWNISIGGKDNGKSVKELGCFLVGDDHTNQRNYDVINELQGEIIPIAISSDIDLTVDSTDNAIELSDSVSFKFDTVNHEVVSDQGTFWFNIDSGKSLIIRAEDDISVKTVNEEGVYSGCTLDMTTDKNAFENIVFVDKNNKYYGPVTIKYQYDEGLPIINPEKTFEPTSLPGGGFNYSITKELFSDDKSGIESNRISLYKGGVSDTVETIKSNFDVIMNTKKTDVVETIDSSEIVYCLLEDKAGNKNVIKLTKDIWRDYEAPTAEISLLSADFTNEEDKKYPTKLQIKIAANDMPTHEEEEEVFVSGIDKVTLRLFDGADKNNYQKYGEDIVCEANKTDGVGDDSYETTISLDGTNMPGYQLHFLVIVTDVRGLERYYYGYWKEGSVIEEVKTNGTINNISLGSNSNKDTDYIHDYNQEYKDNIKKENTFCIVGTPEIMVKIDQDVNVSYNDVDFYNVNVVEGNVGKLSAKLGVKSFGVNSIAFKKAIGENSNSYELYYDLQNHCYRFNDEEEFKDGVSWITWKFVPNDVKKPYEIKLSSTLPFKNEITQIVAKNKTVEFTDGYKFVVNDSSVNLPEPSITYMRGDKELEWKEAHNHKYSNGELTAVVRISSENLPLEYVDGNVTLTCKNKAGNIIPCNFEGDWLSDDENNEYVNSIHFENDGYYEISIMYNNYPGSQSDPKTDIFIIDSTAPTFDISFDGDTNHILREMENEENKESVFFYGLEDGKNKAKDIEATLTFVEANFFDFMNENNEDKEGEIRVQKKDSDGHWNDIVDSSKYKIELTSGSEDQPDTINNPIIYKVTIFGGSTNDGEYQITVDYSDPAGNKMISANPESDVVVTEGEYVSNERVDIIDATRPVAIYTIDECTEGHYEEDGDYYNKQFTTSFEIKDNNFSDKALTVGAEEAEKYLTATVKSSKKSADIPVAEGEAIYKYTVPASPDDEYTFSIKGKDLAGNVLKVQLGNGTTSNDGKEQEIALDTAETEYVSGKKILDTTNPVVSISLDFETNPSKTAIPAGYNRYFFNKDFTVKFAVNEKNYDVKNIFVYSGTNNAAKDYVKDSVGEINKKVDSSDDAQEFIMEAKEDGLYAYSIEGCDKAGNPIVIKPVIEKEDGTLDTSNKYVECYSANGGKNGKGKAVSYVFVLDKVAPTTFIEMDNFYKAKLTNDAVYTASKNKPYQKKTNAIITFTEDDKSPASLSYKIVSTLDGQSKVVKESAYDKNFSHSVEMKGAQTYHISELSVVDLAGNEVIAPTLRTDAETKTAQVSNKIYLDTTPPKYDNLAPTINFVAKASGAGRGPEGNPLFNTDVPVKVTITDPEERKSSTGLYEVYYQILVNDGDVTDKIKPASGSNGNAGTSGKVTYGTGGPHYSDSDPVDTKDEKLTYSDTLTFNFSKEAFNNNNIKIYVWAVDNAGNDITKAQAAYYAFGIDNTSPSISVGYDNNAAENGKYFKANRTATITVTERNFDAGRTNISTEAAAHVSGWTYQRGSSDNGDDDRWIATVVYDTDGDYTLGVSATDLVGHSAGGVNWGDSVAPTAFTIDKTLPVIIITFDNMNAQNGRYYNANRHATIDITEHNFDAKDAVVERTATIAEGTVAIPVVGAWTRQNDLNRTGVFFGQDGDYTMKVDYKDLAGNIAETKNVDLFTIDTVAPTLEIKGVEDKHAYNGNVAPSIVYHDINYDKSSAEVKITGYKHISGSNLKGVRNDEAFGGSFVCDNIEEIRENDDIYKAVGSVKDLAGNETSKDITFSVNRFGSTYILDDETEDLVERVYTNQEQTLGVTEINVNELAKTEVSYSVNGEVKQLEKGTDFTVESENPGWWQYDYTIDASNFEKEGNYTVTLYSEDGADNKNTNRSVKENSGKTSELPVEFVIDKTAPTLIITGVEENGKYREDQRAVLVRYEDNSYIDNLKLYVNDQLFREYDSKTLAEAGGELNDYVAQASASRQSIRVEATDAAGNEGKTEISRFLLTKNFFIQYVNNTPLLIGTILGIAALGIGLFLILFLRRRKKENY